MVVGQHGGSITAPVFTTTQLIHSRKVGVRSACSCRSSVGDLPPRAAEPREASSQDRRAAEERREETTQALFQYHKQRHSSRGPSSPSDVNTHTLTWTHAHARRRDDDDEDDDDEDDDDDDEDDDEDDDDEDDGSRSGRIMRL